MKLERLGRGDLGSELECGGNNNNNTQPVTARINIDMNCELNPTVSSNLGLKPTKIRTFDAGIFQASILIPCIPTSDCLELPSFEVFRHTNVFAWLDLCFEVLQGREQPSCHVCCLV